MFVGHLWDICRTMVEFCVYKVRRLIGQRARARAIVHVTTLGLVLGFGHMVGVVIGLVLGFIRGLVLGLALAIEFGISVCC